MDTWNVTPAPAVDLVTQALQKASLLDASERVASGVDGVGWAGQSLPTSDPNMGNGAAMAASLVSVSKGPRHFQRNNSKDRNKMDGRKAKSYKKLWEQVTKVGRGDNLQGDGKVVLSELSVDDLVRMIRNLPADKSVVAAMQQPLHYLDSRALAALLKELAKCGCVHRAVELFDWLRELETGHELHGLCDVYTYTTMISLCGVQQQLRRALELVAELRSRGIHCNVHTYSSLMNVCIKCGELELALDVYKQMRAEGAKPNVVTYNTLIDVYGKTGQWDKAVGVLDHMQDEGLAPEVRTYNTAIIACNMCGQPSEALKVYDMMRQAGHAPISTTYTALISAYGKAGQLDKALETFNEMVANGCERSVITYSALINACEKAGRWELALELFDQMHRDQCPPNTVTYNSLITACAQGAQCDKAGEVFEHMKACGCKPDVVTFTALIGAFDRGGRWFQALKVFETMSQQGCKPDAIIYHQMIDMLWNTSVLWAQAKALQLLDSAVRNCQFRLVIQQVNTELKTLEVVVPSSSAAVAVLSTYDWLKELRSLLDKDGPGVLQEQVVVMFGRGSRQQRDPAVVAARQAVATLLYGHHTPLVPIEADITHPNFALQCPARLMQEWLTSQEWCRMMIQLADVQRLASEFATKKHHLVEIASQDLALEARCHEIFQNIKVFENTHRLNYQAMGQGYLQLRRTYVETMFNLARSLGIMEGTVHDAILIMDRVMSTGMQLAEPFGVLFLSAILLLAGLQGEGGENLPHPDQLDASLNLSLGSLASMQHSIRMALCNDTQSISSMQCLRLYFERLGFDAKDWVALPLRSPRGRPAAVSDAFQLLHQAVLELGFLNVRPSVVAAAVVYVDRKHRGWVPCWPASLAHLTGLHDLTHLEFIAAIKSMELLRTSLISSPRVALPMLEAAPGVAAVAAVAAV